MYKITRKKELNANVTLMDIEAPFVARKAKAGQFIIFRIDEQGERVPLTIAGYDREKGTVTIIFQKVGFTTKALGELNEGDYIHDFVGPLGNPSETEEFKGKKVAVTWAYSPSYGKPLSCPQSLISLLPRFGMDVTLAHPEGYDLMPEVVERAKGYAAESGTTFKQVNTMAEAFEGADIVIPKSWAPFAAMEKRTNLYAEGDDAGIAALEKELLAQNATHQDWCSTTELMEKTANGQDTIFMHPLPADISGVSCEHGEVNADVFDMHRVGMYKEASYKPYAIAAMMFLQKVADPAATLKALDERNTARWLQA